MPKLSKNKITAAQSKAIVLLADKFVSSGIAIRVLVATRNRDSLRDAVSDSLVILAQIDEVITPNTSTSLILNSNGFYTGESPTHKLHIFINKEL